MTNDNQTPGYYTPIDGRLTGPITKERIEYSHGSMAYDTLSAEYERYLQSLPSYPVSPDLELTDRMYENLDFEFHEIIKTGSGDRYKLACPIPTPAGKREGEINILEWVNMAKSDPFPDDPESKCLRTKKNGSYIYFQTEDFEDNYLIHDGEEIPYSEVDYLSQTNPRSFTSKDMEVVLDLIGLKFRDKELVAVAHPTNGNTMWMVDEKSKWSMPITTSELLNQFLNREVK